MQDFPDGGGGCNGGGGANPYVWAENLLFVKIFAKHCMKMKWIELRRDP